MSFFQQVSNKNNDNPHSSFFKFDNFRRPRRDKLSHKEEADSTIVEANKKNLTWRSPLISASPATKFSPNIELYESRLNQQGRPKLTQKNQGNSSRSPENCFGPRSGSKTYFPLSDEDYRVYESAQASKSHQSPSNSPVSKKRRLERLSNCRGRNDFMRLYEEIKNRTPNYKESKKSYSNNNNSTSQDENNLNLHYSTSNELDLPDFPSSESSIENDQDVEMAPKYESIADLQRSIMNSPVCSRSLKPRQSNLNPPAPQESAQIGNPHFSTPEPQISSSTRQNFQFQPNNNQNRDESMQSTSSFPASINFQTENNANILAEENMYNKNIYNQTPLRAFPRNFHQSYHQAVPPFFDTSSNIMPESHSHYPNFDTSFYVPNHNFPPPRDICQQPHTCNSCPNSQRTLPNFSMTDYYPYNYHSSHTPSLMMPLPTPSRQLNWQSPFQQPPPTPCCSRMIPNFQRHRDSDEETFSSIPGKAYIMNKYFNYGNHP